MSVPLSHRFPEVAFGTSGLRALVQDLSPPVVGAYVTAFVSRLEALGLPVKGSKLALAMDLRPSSPGIAASVCAALQPLECEVEFLGIVPTPTLALFCQQHGCAGIMITGSHIPFDRNGLKFYRPDGEITKDDERAMTTLTADSQEEVPPVSALPPVSVFPPHSALPPVNPSAYQAYARRYLDFFGGAALGGLRLGHYQHSAAGRDLTHELLTKLGADVIALGRSDEFVPIDTEAVSADDRARAAAWCQQHRLDAIVSTDGDGDRPLVFDENGNFVRGDLLGLLCARHLGIGALAVPLSCNTGIEASGAFERVERTRIGSPYVIEAMHDLLADDAKTVAGFEANGGFMLASPLPGLTALPTRDALLPMIAVLAQVAAGAWPSLSALVARLPARFTDSDRLSNIDTDAARALLARLMANPEEVQILLPTAKPLAEVSSLDGLRFTFADGDILHLRLSGNAPELRCYAEAANPEAARLLIDATLAQLEKGLAGA